MNKCFLNIRPAQCAGTRAGAVYTRCARRWATTLCMALVMVLAAHAQGSKTCIDSGWRFRLGPCPEAAGAQYDDSQWRLLDLPHDWSVEPEAAQSASGSVGPFSQQSVGGSATGHTVGGEGWYRKTFSVQRGTASERVVLYFEGVYNQSTVYLNGRKLYFNPYGYSSFRIDVTDHLAAPGTDNVLAVCVQNQGANTRWYAGSGIYRHVWLITTPAIYLDAWDTAITTPTPQCVEVATLVHNALAQVSTVRVVATVRDHTGAEVATTTQQAEVAGHAQQAVQLQLDLSAPQLWSPDSPYLYTLELEASEAAGQRRHLLHIPFGVRTIAMDAGQGFLLNGQPLLLRGGCVHHDNGLLGAAAYNRAEERRLALLKANGFNAVRCSHNIPSEHFLHVCDSLGLMVIDEAFDHWLVAKNSQDYARYFSEFSDRDLQTMLRRDRNHPSIIMWSIGNEVPGRIEPSGLQAAERLRTTVRRYDTTRPVTAAICDWDTPSHSWDEESSKAFLSLDAGGYNYLYNKYETDHARYPQRVMYGSESYPKRASENWDLVERLPYVIGDFVWTAMDYLGEAGIASASIRSSGQQSMFQPWPWYNGWCGDIDLIGQKKPQSYYRDVVWRLAPITMGVQRPIPAGRYQSISNWGWQLEEQSWTFPELQAGEVTAVNVYSRAPLVRMYLNGRVVGEKAPGSTYWAGFDVPYEPGELKAVNVVDGTETDSFVLTTTTEPVALHLQAHRTRLNLGDATDLSYVTITLTDGAGRPVTSNSTTRIHISVSGQGELLAAGNASPTDMESFRSQAPLLYRGRALAIIKGSGQAGQVTVRVSCDGLPDAELILTVTAADEGGQTTLRPAPAGTRPGANKAQYRTDGVQVPGQAGPQSGIYVQEGKKQIRRKSM